MSSPSEAFLDPQILTFAGFAGSTVANSIRPIRPISKLQKGRILQQVVESSLGTGKLRHFSRVAKTPGFLAQVDEFIAELKRQDVWPEDFMKLCRQQRDHDLAIIYEHYQKFLNDNNLYDAEGCFWVAREVLSKSTLDTSEFGLIVVDGFSDFTSAQYDILERLSKRALDMLITLTLDPKCLEPASEASSRSVLFAKTKNTLERLRQKLPGIELELGGTAQFASPALEHLERNLFRDPDETDSAGPTLAGIEILAANGMHGEIEEIARRIKGLLHNGQARAEGIVVVFRNLRDIAERINEVFADHGIPCSLGSWQEAARLPLLRGILSLLRLHAEDWPFGQLLAVVGSRLFRKFDLLAEDGNQFPHDARIAIERCLRAAQLPSGKLALLEQLRRWASGAGKDVSEVEDEKIEKLASQAKLSLAKLEGLADLLKKLPQQALLAEWIGHLERLLDGLDVFPKQNESSSTDLRRTVSAWNTLRGGLRALEMVDGWSASEASELSVVELLDLLETVGSCLRLPEEHDAVGRVRVLNAESARTVSAKQFFLAGLKEKSFAASDPEDPLFGARDLGRPELRDGDPTFQQLHAGDEMLLFYELVTRATEKLTLSYPALDEKGQALSPSPLLTELEQCFGNALVPRTAKPLNDTSTDSPMSASAYRRQAVAQALQGDRNWLAGMAIEPKSARLGRSLLDGIGCVARRGERGQFGPYEGLLQSKTAQTTLAKRFDAAHLWSPSQLESYATCPFRFFAEQILLLEPSSELTLRSDARRRGSLLHQVLATLHEHLESSAEEEGGDATSRLIARFQEVLNKAVASTPLEGLQRWLREIERREIEAWTDRYAQQEADYRGKWDHLDEPLRPAFFEVRFGPQVRSGSSTSSDDASTVLPFELDLGSEQILLTGQIDRVDVGRVGGVTVFNIIDYKSGAEVKLQPDKIRSGRQLQLPLYALAAERHLLADQEALALATGYWSIQGQGFESRRGNSLEIRELKDQAIHTSEQWDQLQPVLLQRIGQLVSGIRGGEFPVLNEDEHCTRSCSFSTICRVAHARSLEKEWEVGK